MTLYLLKCTQSNRYVLELYGNDALRRSWSNWQNSEPEAMATPLQHAWYKPVTVDERIISFNDARKHLDGSTLIVLSTYTPESHPEMFL